MVYPCSRRIMKHGVSFICGTGTSQVSYRMCHDAYIISSPIPKAPFDHCVPANARCFTARGRDAHKRVHALFFTTPVTRTTLNCLTVLLASISWRCSGHPTNARERSPGNSIAMVLTMEMA